MSLKKMMLALAAVLAFGAVTTSNAFALEAVTSPGAWYVGGTKLADGTANGAELACSIGEHEGKKFVLTSTVGTNNTPLKLTATGVECTTGTKIFNEVIGEKTEAHAEGRIRFTGVTVSEPAGCSVEGGAVETEELTAEVQMEKAGGAGKTYIKFAPKAGTTFATVPIIGCAIALEYPVKGTLFGESVNATGVEATEQKVTFSEAIQKTAGGSLTFGGKAAQLTGQGIFKLKGKETTKWKAQES
jgi:hypothetical protein